MMDEIPHPMVEMDQVEEEEEEEVYESSTTNDTHEDSDSDTYDDDDDEDNSRYSIDDQLEEAEEDDDDDDDSLYENDVTRRSKKSDIFHPHHIKQHLLAVFVAIVAATITHANIMHGGYDAWKDALWKDWMELKMHLIWPMSSATSRETNDDEFVSSAATTAPYYYAAPSMNGIPTMKRRQVLQRGINKNSSTTSNSNHGGKSTIGGHEHAKNFRRTRSLSFCPLHEDHPNTSVATNTIHKDASSNDNNIIGHNLVEMEFVLSLEPSVRILHSYYLADVLGMDSSMVYNNNNNKELGSYASDTILNEIDTLNKLNNNIGLTFEQISSILQSHLRSNNNDNNEPGTVVSREHACLLQQYTLHKSSGRSIRGRTKVYHRPHVTNFYPTDPSSSSKKLLPASLSFTGYAAKFCNLSLKPLNLYWDGGRIPSGPNAGKMHTVLVGTIPSMESMGTSSFPGHSFYVTPTYDKSHILQRWTITEDEPILYYDPLEDMSLLDQAEEIGKWDEKQRFYRDAWIVDRSFGRDYLVRTGRVWLANFPTPFLHFHEKNDETVSPMGVGSSSLALFGSEVKASVERLGHTMHMWQADYIGQVHIIETSNLHFTTLPERLVRLTKEDYLPEVEKARRLEMLAYQSTSWKGTKTHDNAVTSTMPLSLKVISCAPRVLEVPTFLSHVEVQHLIDLASGSKGNVIMERSTVSAQSYNSEPNKQDPRSKSDARSSTNGWIHREQDVIIDTIFRRIADILNIDEMLMRDQDYSGIEHQHDKWLPTYDRIVEAMQLVRYGPGEEYSAHHDFTYPSITNRYQPKRYATVLLYLTGEGDVVEDGVRLSADNDRIMRDKGLVGGETIFPRAVTTNYHDGIKVKCSSGKAVVFYNVLPDGNMDDLSQHTGGKVERGVKYLANVWVWDPIVN